MTAIFLAIQMTLQGRHHDRAKWQVFPLMFGVKAAFPDKPTHDSYPLPVGKSERFSWHSGKTSYRVSLELPVTDSLPREIADNPTGEKVKQSMDFYLRGILKALGDPDAKVRQSSFGGFKGYPATRWQIESGDMSLYVLRILTPSCKVAMLAETPTDDVNLSKTQRFFDSVRFSE